MSPDLGDMGKQNLTQAGSAGKIAGIAKAAHELEPKISTALEPKSASIQIQNACNH